MRIAIFGIKTLPAFAGADRVAERLVEHLPQHDYTIYLVRDDATKLTCSDDRHYVYVPTLKGKHLRAFSFFLLSALHFLVKGRAEVAHVHNSDFGFFCPILRLRRSVRVVGTFHGRPYRRDKWGRGAKAFLQVSERVFIRSCDVLTSVAPMEIAGRDVQHIPNGVDAPEVAEAGNGFDYEGLGLSRGDYVLFACGRLDRTKGLHVLLEAYRALPGQTTLLAVGDFSHDAAYSHEIEESARADDRVVLYRSLLDRPTLFDVTRNASVFVFPSAYEAMSMMLLEAIACRKVVVCSDIPENVAVVGEGYPFLFRSSDSASLAEVLTRAKGADDAVRDVYEEIVSRYRWSEIADRYDSIYRRLAASSA